MGRSVTLSPTSVHRTAGLTSGSAVRRRRSLWPYWFASPAIAAMGFGFVYPLVSVVRNSLYAGRFSRLDFVGLRNFKILFSDDVFITALTNNLKLLLTVPVMTVLALLIALIFHEGVRGARFHRTAIFIPYILPAVAIGLAFSAFLQFNGGLNAFLRAVGLERLALDWLGSPNLAIWSIGAVVIWQQLGFGVVIFLAALLSLPVEVTEAARIDGVSWWQLQTHVHIPQIRGSIEFFLVTEAITVLSWVFAYVFVLTQGGPSNSSTVMEYYIWKNGFAQGSVGLANAAAMVVLVLAGILIFVYMRLRLRPDEGGAMR